MPPRPIFTFPDDADWNEPRQAVEFGVEIGDYVGRAFLPAAAMRTLLGHKPTPAEAVEVYHFHRTAIERAVELRIEERRLDPDANVTLDGRDLRQR
jgi:hypothetical protein